MSAERTTITLPVPLEEAQRLYPDQRTRLALSRAVLRFVDGGVMEPAEASAAYRLGEPGIYGALAMFRGLTIGEDTEVPTYSL